MTTWTDFARVRETMYNNRVYDAFKIYNAGNIPIHPFEEELKIIIYNVEGSTSSFELQNTTNGSLFKVNEAVPNTVVIELDGPRIKKDGLAYLRNTNRKYIELSPGMNDFKITGATRADFQFIFRFYYR
ncbi:phage tail domain-containing protein [Virgibacillus siamensis]|uniref:phage tail domain-containing protein n=1 Tax=Virgibacillus siamensis TaxID=480071 RepID=UPI0009849B22|nr:phage tail domain-containing protein [Virgibacillus siamensis]